MKLKAMNLLKDLLVYDSNLHLTVNNIENFANTNASKAKSNFHMKEEESLKPEDNILE